MKPKRRNREGGEPFKWILLLCLPVEHGKVDLALPLGSVLYIRLTRKGRHLLVGRSRKLSWNGTSDVSKRRHFPEEGNALKKEGNINCVFFLLPK
ncbi:hypothetical protein CgunFtcFv8_023545 [Champsocephalus gunnari]|uniref:Uncharacterized protein n=1 Tax=Champsocephalus gunnari TaxID=52237 RepID=A0AAN8HLA2_CHAGU|nr:hypothetical protein CgunFtcFv8_023545 [Champsocephalus gunnari]